jgi:hypothetical protein
MEKPITLNRKTGPVGAPPVLINNFASEVATHKLSIHEVLRSPSGPACVADEPYLPQLFSILGVRKHFTS